jgi:hypothetical protein
MIEISWFWLTIIILCALYIGWHLPRRFCIGFDPHKYAACDCGIFLGRGRQK